MLELVVSSLLSAKESKWSTAPYRVRNPIFKERQNKFRSVVIKVDAFAPRRLQRQFSVEKSSIIKTIK